VYVTVQVRDQPVVSLETVLVSQFCVCITPVGSQENATVTLVVYQVLEHPPPLHATLIGTALAAGTKTSSGTQTSSNTRGYRQAYVISLHADSA
jgi:hypothetical protein